MKTLIGIFGLAAIVATGLWFAGATATERVVRGWLDARESAGWVVNYQAVETGGFPTRFTTDITDLTLADPTTGWAWTAPDFTLSQRPWRPDHITATWPQNQTIASPFERLDVAAGAIVAELDVQPTANLALDAARTEMQQVTLTSNLGGVSSLESGLLDVTRQEGQTARYSVLFEATDLTPPSELVTLLDPAGEMPATLENLRYAADMSFDRPWDLSALEQSRPQITQINLEEMQAQWGALLFRAAGNLDVDDQGRATGEIALRAENWRQMLDMGSRAGVLADAVRATAETALGFLAGLSGRPEDIDATLRLDEGFVFLGPLPIGEAPRIILR